MQNEQLAAKRKKLKPWILIALALLAAALLILLGFRLKGWLQRGQDSRLTALVNPWNGIDNSGYLPKLTEVEGVRIDKSARRPLQEMLDASRQEGFSPVLTAGYRSGEEQQALFDETVRGLLSGG